MGAFHDEQDDAGLISAPLEERDDVILVGKTAGRPHLWTWIIALSCSSSYALTYCWRYPVFVLPDDYLSQRVISDRFDLHACLSLAFIFGFGLAKIPAARVALR